jgi:hypothetical protein
VTAFNGNASNVGVPSGGSAVTFSENFTFNGNINLQTATLTVVNVLQEVGGAGELLQGVPVTLTYAGTDPDDGPFFSPPGNPAFRFNVKIQDPQQGKWTSKLRVDNGVIPNYPTKCAMVSSNNYRTNLTTTFRINPSGGGAPLAVTTTQSWQCRDWVGLDPNKPATLRTP